MVQKDSRGGLVGRALRAAAVVVALALAVAGCVDATGTPEAGLPVPGDGGDGALTAIETTRAVVVRVIDGDTAVFRLSDGREEKTRFIGIDTPESTTRHEPFGAEASAYTKRLLPRGRAVWLETDADLRDRYGRLLAYVWLEPPETDPESEAPVKMLNAKLALDGYAAQMTVPPNVRYAHVFAECVAQAREAGRGLWGLQP